MLKVKLLKKKIERKDQKLKLKEKIKREIGAEKEMKRSLELIKLRRRDNLMIKD